MSTVVLSDRVRNISVRIEKWRGILGCSQNAIARKARVDNSLLAKLLLGKCQAAPSCRRLERFLDRMDAKEAAAQRDRVA